MSSPLFSIIIPTYNAEKYLNSCVDSILSQNHNSCEILLFDDGSTDGSGAICDEYAQKYPHTVRVFHQENAGLVLTRRRALCAAEGEYILFLDSDDCMAENALSVLDELIKLHDHPDMIIYMWAHMDENGVACGPEYEPLFREGPVTREALLRKMAEREGANSLCIKMIRRGILNIDDDYTDHAHIRSGEDLLQSIPLVMKAESIYYYPQPLYLYRVNTASMTWVFNSANLFYITTVRPYLYRTLTENGLDDPQTRQYFFNTHLERLFYFLQTMTDSNTEQAIVVRCLDALWADSLLVTARDYLDSSQLTKYQKQVLHQFYNKKIFRVRILIRFRSLIQRLIAVFQ